MSFAFWWPDPASHWFGFRAINFASLRLGALALNSDRRVMVCGETCAPKFDGDKSPAESGDESPQPKGFAVSLSPHVQAGVVASGKAVGARVREPQRFREQRGIEKLRRLSPVRRRCGSQTHCRQCRPFAVTLQKTFNAKTQRRKGARVWKDWLVCLELHLLVGGCGQPPGSGFARSTLRLCALAPWR